MYSFLLSGIHRTSLTVLLRSFLFFTLLFFGVTPLCHRGLAEEWETLIDVEKSTEKPAQPELRPERPAKLPPRKDGSFLPDKPDWGATGGSQDTTSSSPSQVIHGFLKSPFVHLSENMNFHGELIFTMHGITKPGGKPVKAEFTWEK